MRRTAVLGLLFTLLARRGAGADPPAITIIGVAGSEPGGAVLIGQGGETFARDGSVWRRRGGGVAALLVRAWGTAATEIWAAAPRPPLYHHDGKSWFAVPGPGGAGAALLADAGSPVPAMAVGRRLFVHDGKRLMPGPVAPGPVTALWATSPREVLVIVDGKLQRSAAAGWKPVSGADENLIVLGPRLALGQDGGVYAIDARLRKLPSVPGFKPRLVAGTPRRTVLIGALGDGYAAALVEGGKVVLLGALPGLARADEPAGLIAGDTLLVASRSGLVLSGDGKTWRTEAIAPNVDETPHAAEPPAPIPSAK